ncbi:MAG: hypothetical protein D6773_15445, partial [Alphaproteobacteria bacterium]
MLYDGKQAGRLQVGIARFRHQAGQASSEANMKQDGSDRSDGADGGEEVEIRQGAARPLTPQAHR